MDLNNEETLYWLGYICADGNVEYNESSRIYKVSLFSKDECVINDFIDYFGKEICKKYKMIFMKLQFIQRNYVIILLII